MKNKYGNKKVKINEGETLDSELEYARYCELKILERAKEIQDLRRQVSFELQPSYRKNNKTIKPIYYKADFVYFDKNGKIIVEDTKGYKTEIYKIKKKIFEYKYPELEIKEIRKEDLRWKESK